MGLRHRPIKDAREVDVMSDGSATDWVEDLIDSMEEGFTTSTRMSLSDVDDGKYKLKIVNAAIDKIPSSGNPIVRWELLFVGGPYDGNTVERVSFLNNQVGLNILGADLVLLGCLDKDHNKSKEPLSKKIMGALASAQGKVFNASKTTSVSEKNGKTYHNFRVLGLKAEDNSDQP